MPRQLTSPGPSAFSVWTARAASIEDGQAHLDEILAVVVRSGRSPSCGPVFPAPDSCRIRAFGARLRFLNGAYFTPDSTVLDPLPDEEHAAWGGPEIHATAVQRAFGRPTFVAH